ncbi:MAG: NUDIX hydrolase [candidate division WOR-3 bacterium]
MQYKNPFPTVDIIIEMENGIILIKRKNPPYGWAIPGGFIDYGESAESAAIREAKEETNLDVFDLKQFHVYSDPKRDPRFHTISVVFTAKGKGTPKAKDDAIEIEIFNKNNLPEDIAFDHRKILDDYFSSQNENKMQKI